MTDKEIKELVANEILKSKAEQYVHFYRLIPSLGACESKTRRFRLNCLQAALRDGHYERILRGDIEELGYQ